SGAPQPEANRAKRAAATAAQSRAHMTHPRRCCRSAFTGVDEALAAPVDTAAIAGCRRVALADHALTLTPSSVCWLGLEVRFINSPPQRDGRVRVECEPPSVRPQNFIGAAPMCWANEPLLTNERQEKVLTRDS